MSVLWETRAPAESEQQACPHDKVEYLGSNAMFRCIGPDGGCGAEMCIPEWEDRYKRKCDE